MANRIGQKAFSTLVFSQFLQCSGLYREQLLSSVLNTSTLCRTQQREQCFLSCAPGKQQQEIHQACIHMVAIFIVLLVLGVVILAAVQCLEIFHNSWMPQKSPSTHQTTVSTEHPKHKENSANIVPNWIVRSTLLGVKLEMDASQPPQLRKSRVREHNKPFECHGRQWCGLYPREEWQLHHCRMETRWSGSRLSSVEIRFWHMSEFKCSLGHCRSQC